MNKLLALLIKVPSSLLLGGIVAVGLMQNDPWLQHRLQKMIVRSVSSIVGESYLVTVSAIDLLGGKVTLENTSIVSSQGDWAFHCPEMQVAISWLSWVKGEGFESKVTLFNPTLFTTYKKGFAIEKPFYALVEAPMSVPLNLIQCIAENATVTILSPVGELSAQCSTITSLEKEMVTTKLLCSDGHMLKEGTTLFAHTLSGTMTVHVPRNDDPYNMQLTLSCVRSGEREAPYQLYYAIKDDVGVFKWRADDGSVTVEVDDIRYGETSTGSLAVAGGLRELASLVIDDEVVKEAGGTGVFTGQVAVHDQGYRYEGTTSLKDVEYRGIQVSQADITLTGDHTGATATIEQAHTGGLWLAGELTGTFAKGLTGIVRLLKPYDAIAQCVLRKGRAAIAYDGTKLQADFKGQGSVLDAPMPIKGRLVTDFSTATLKGTCAGNPLKITANVSPFKVKNVSLKDPLRISRLAIAETEDGAIKGVVDSVLLKKVVQVVTGHQLVGDAHLQVRSDGSRVTINVEDASLKIPGTYTVIKEVAGTIDFASTDKCVILHDLVITFHKGSAWSSCATIYFAEDGTLVHAHIPLQCKGVLISKEKELFGTLSGGITVEYDDTWRAKGMLAIENAHLRSNLLSSKVQRELVHASSLGAPLLKAIELDLHLQSRSPIKVQTPFFTSDAHLDVSIKGSAEQPTVEGSIELAHGKFAFPYKSLFVTNGTLTLSPLLPDGPTINLVAKNKIRAYSVTMRVNGSLHQPNVSFESSPQLSEEGIITLLLVGADHGSFTAAVPRVLMDQIEDILFGSEGSLTRLQQVLKGLLAPLKNVRLKKDETQDELQAVLEVDINDRLRATAQNNINLTDETQLELEYVVSDDVTVKAVRDQTGSLGGEVEMRWKF